MEPNPTYMLSSGYTVRVRTLGPFALDPIRVRHQDPGPFTYKVETAAEGVVDFVYDLPDPAPLPPSEGEQGEWELYQAYRAHQRKREQIAREFERESTDFVMLNCFDIVDGPATWQDDEWLERIAPFVDNEGDSSRRLLFRKTQVFAVPFEEWAAIRQLCVAPEVDLEGIFNALANFRADLGWRGSTRDMGPAAGGETEPQHAGVGDPGGGGDAP